MSHFGHLEKVTIPQCIEFHKLNSHIQSYTFLRLLSDLCLTGLQISTNQRATRKCIWGSIQSPAFPEGKFTYSVKKEWYSVFDS